MDPIRLSVTHAHGTYDVLVGEGLLDGASALLASIGLTPPPVVMSCPPVWRAHGHRLAPLLDGREPLLMADGERAKTLGSVARLYEGLVKAGADRRTPVVAFGGGVVGDVAGFAAASYLRGLRVVQVPTTLLAQVDSSIGGKTGVNLPAGKNLVGAFHAPSLVICDPSVLRTLPRREFRAGLYEAIKYGVIASRPLFDRISRDLDALFARDMATLTEVIAECCRIKADVVMADEHEQGPRRTLNFGHTAGHALEAITRYRRFRHGEAVGLGMIAATELAVTRGLCAGEVLEALRALITRMGPMPATTDLRIDEALTAMGRDKKVAAGRLHYVLPVGLGGTVIVDDVTQDELTHALRAIGLH
jgi:3-dehydroquinate synthase